MSFKSSRSLDLLAQVLRGGGYVVDGAELDDVGGVLLAETPYALVVGVEVDWADMEQRVAMTQAALTNIAAESPSARSWDLYVVVIAPAATTPAQDAAREAVEADTRYARKLLILGARETRDIERSVRALLPLQPPADVDLIDAVEALRTALIEQGVDHSLVATALDSFEAQGVVQVP